jgi:hypothetical protein
MSTLPLSQAAYVIRSKNAGPRCLTVHLFLLDRPSFERTRHGAALNLPSPGALYCPDASQIRRFDLRAILAIKLSMPRGLCARDPGGGNVYAG